MSQSLGGGKKCLHGSLQRVRPRYPALPLPVTTGGKRKTAGVCFWSVCATTFESRVSTRGGEQVAEEVLEVDEELMLVLRENRILVC